MEHQTPAIVGLALPVVGLVPAVDLPADLCDVPSMDFRMSLPVLAHASQFACGSAMRLILAHLAHH